MNRKYIFIALTVLVMLAVSRFAVRIVDATVQIDDDTGILVLMLAGLNVLIALISFRLYRYAENRKQSRSEGIR